MKISFNPSNSNKNILDLIKNNKDIIFDLKGHSIFARGVEFKGTDTNTWRPVVDNLTSDSTTSSLSAKQGKVLKALIDGKSNSDHNHDGRYVKKSGDTMQGVLTIATTNFGALTIKRNDDVGSASIQFRGESSVYGYIGLNNGTKDKQFLRWSSDTSRIYTILDTSSTYISNGKGVINGTTITQVDNARKLVNWYSARPTSLNAQFGDGSLRIFYATSSTTEGKPAEDSHILHLAWDNTGGWDAQLAVHARSGKVSTRAQISGTWQPWKTLAFLDSKVADSDKLDGVHLNGIFTGFSYAQSRLTATIGTVSKTVNVTGSYPSIGGVTMNTIASYGNCMGMANLASSNSNVNPNNQTSWHHFINMSYNTESTNMQQTQFAIKAGTTEVWVRSRAGGSISDSSAWAAPWVRLARITDNIASATNADMVDGYHANGLLTALSNSNNGISITVGGTTKSISNINVNYAASAGNANTLDGIDSTRFLRQVVVPNNTENDFNTFSNMTLTGRVDPTTGASLKNAPWSGSGPAGGYGVLTYLFNGETYGTQMAWGYSNNRIYIRNRYWDGSGAGIVWRTSWDTLALTSDIPTVTNYYWANVKISASSSTTTSPTFSNVYLGNSLYLNNKGSNSIYNGPNDSANGVGGPLNNLVFSSWQGVSFTTSCAGLTYTNKNAVSINCRTGQLYAREVQANGFMHTGHNNNDAVLLAGGGYKTLKDFMFFNKLYNYTDHEHYNLAFHKLSNNLVWVDGHVKGSITKSFVIDPAFFPYRYDEDPTLNTKYLMSGNNFITINAVGTVIINNATDHKQRVGFFYIGRA